jgi:prevent-host-death family protein
MVKTEIPAGQFKAKCLALLDEVRDEQKELIITKRGVAVARVLPMEPAGKKKKIQYGGRAKGTMEILGDIFSTGEKWEAWDD